MVLTYMHFWNLLSFLSLLRQGGKKEKPHIRVIKLETEELGFNSLKLPNVEFNYTPRKETVLEVTCFKAKSWIIMHV